MKPRLFPVLPLLAALLSFSCGTTEKERAKTDIVLKSRSSTALKYSPPKGAAGGRDREKWTAVRRADGSEWVQAKDGMNDVVSLYGFSSPVDASIKSVDDLERLLKADSSMGFSKLERGQVLGTPVLRFEKTAKDEGAASARLAASLNQPARDASQEYMIRTHGALLFQGGAQPRFITLACSRTSAHGEIGTYYESLYEDFLSSFVADNRMGQSPASAAAATESTPGIIDLTR